MTDRDGAGEYGDPFEAASKRFEERHRNPRYKDDPIWLGLKVPSEEPWRPFADRKAVEKAAANSAGEGLLMGNLSHIFEKRVSPVDPHEWTDCERRAAEAVRATRELSGRN